MVWLRIDDQIAHHPKFIEAGPLASWLWVCGNGYCNKYLTDGFIPKSALKALGTVPSPLKWAQRLVEVGLWESVHNGYRVHDFHDHNPTAADVKAKREADRQRKDSRRNPHGIVRDSNVSPAGSASARARASDPVPSDPVPVEEKTKSARFSPPLNGTTDPELGERAGNFCRRYAELYQQHRRGARYLPKPALDWPKACELCAVWPDARLEMLAVVFLKCEEPFAQSGSRTIGQFAAMASWADGRLAEVEAGRQ